MNCECIGSPSKSEELLISGVRGGRQYCCGVKFYFDHLGEILQGEKDIINGNDNMEDNNEM